MIKYGKDIKDQISDEKYSKRQAAYAATLAQFKSFLNAYVDFNKF